MIKTWINGLLINPDIVLVVVDTNVLLVSISSRSKYHWLYRLILDKKIHIGFTHDILIEYEEQIGIHCIMM